MKLKIVSKIMIKFNIYKLFIVKKWILTHFILNPNIGGNPQIEIKFINIIILLFLNWLIINIWLI